MTENTIGQNFTGPFYYLARFGSAFIDLIVIGFFYYVIGTLIAMNTIGALRPYGFHLEGIPALKLFALTVFSAFAYFWLSEGIFGRTLGKMVGQLKVIQENGQTCSLTASLIRNLLRPLDYFFCNLVGIIFILTTKKQQRVGDLVAKTQVVRTGSWSLSFLGILLLIGLGVASVFGSNVIRTKPKAVNTNSVDQDSSTSLHREPTSMIVRNIRFTDGKNGPMIQPNYEPGEEINFNFDLEQVSIDEDGNPNVQIKFNAVDEEERALLEPTLLNITKTIQEPDSSIPIYYQLTLPSYLTGGIYRIHFDIQDNLSKDQISKEVTFNVNAPAIPPKSPLSVINFQYLDNENRALADPIYLADDQVRSQFNVIGFKLGPKNQVSIRLDMIVEDTKGKVLMQQPNLVNVNEQLYYPPRYIPISTSLKIPTEIKPSEYTQHFILHDDIAGTQTELNRSFKIR